MALGNWLKIAASPPVPRPEVCAGHSGRSWSHGQQHFQKNSIAKDIPSDRHDFLFHGWVLICQRVKTAAYSLELVNLELKGFLGHRSRLPLAAQVRQPSVSLDSENPKATGCGPP